MDRAELLGTDRTLSRGADTPRPTLDTGVCLL